jgi:CheY-like chemotaxis protein
MPAEPNKTLVQTLKKIPIFNELSPTQLQKILSICKPSTWNPGEIVCHRDSSSEEMYILVSGQLLVKKADGTPVITLSPVTTVGEVALVTRRPYSVDIEATQKSTLLAIQRTHLERLLRDDPDMPIRIYRNMIAVLAARFLKENVRAADFHLQKVQIAMLEKKVAAALDLLAEKGVPGEEAQTLIQEKLKAVVPRVLIVDDEPVIRKVIQRSLPDYQVIEAENGKAALEIMQQEGADLVIADINMPEMDGFELLNHLRSQYPDLPVVGLSGYVSAGEAQHYGFDGFLEKPLKLREITDKVQEGLAKGR